MSNSHNPLFDHLFQQVPSKRKVFISFHHKNDQSWFDHFVDKFSDQYEVFLDKSVGETKVRSDDPEYINRAIREDYIKGSSITIALCGAETYKRKYVDWEIYSTLHYEHALLGIALPYVTKNLEGNILIPDRLYVNIESGYAHFIGWTKEASILKENIEIALEKSKNNRFIDNSLPKMTRNST